MLTYRNDGPWGTGKGSQLTSAEQDANHYDHQARIDALENTPATAVGISNITVIGNQMKIFLSNGGEFGPFTLPTAIFQMRGEYTPGAAYLETDLFTVKGLGLFFVRHPFTAPPVFDPAAVNVDGDRYVAVVFGENAYIMDIGFSFPGKPGQGIAVGEEFMQHIFVRPATLPVDWAGSLARLGEACSATLAFDVMKNGIKVGTLTYAAGTKVGTFTWVDSTNVPARSFAPTDVVGFKRPAAIDATARRMVVTLVATVVNT